MISSAEEGPHCLNCDFVITFELLSPPVLVSRIAWSATLSQSCVHVVTVVQKQKFVDVSALMGKCIINQHSIKLFF